LLLYVQGPGERDVAIEVPLVKFVEDDGLNAPEFRIGNQLPEQNAFGLEFDARGRAREILKPHLIAHFAP
jgi:hypothetical protein